MPWVEAATLANLEEGQGRKICHGSHAAAVFLADGEVYALGDRCSHAEASLSEGEVFGIEVECPLHGAVFDLASGEALTLPAVRPVPSYPTRVEGEKVWVYFADDGAGAI